MFPVLVFFLLVGYFNYSIAILNVCVSAPLFINHHFLDAEFLFLL